MRQKYLINIAFPLAIFSMVLLALVARMSFEVPAHAATQGSATQGSLQAIDASGKLAGLTLKHHGSRRR